MLNHSVHEMGIVHNIKKLPPYLFGNLEFVKGDKALINLIEIHNHI